MGDLGLPGQRGRDHRARRCSATSGKCARPGLNIMMSMKGDGKPVSFIEDCAVPLEHLAEYTDRLTQVFHKHGTKGTWYAHASVGTLHVRPILDMRRDGAHKMRAIAEEAAELVKRIQGRVLGRARRRARALGVDRAVLRPAAHARVRGDQGPVRSEGAAESRQDRAAVEAGRPHAVPLQAGLRQRRATSRCSTGRSGSENDRTEATEPGTAASDGGFAKAVEMCNNNGHCRKFDAGTMCPSYPRDARRAASDARPRQHAAARAVRPARPRRAHVATQCAEALDLCVSCKGCKRECPTGVDMAKMKIEVNRRGA